MSLVVVLCNIERKSKENEPHHLKVMFDFREKREEDNEFKWIEG